MCILQIATEHLNLDKNHKKMNFDFSDKIEAIDKKLSDYVFKQ